MFVTKVLQFCPNLRFQRYIVINIIVKYMNTLDYNVDRENSPSEVELFAERVKNGNNDIIDPYDLHILVNNDENDKIFVKIRSFGLNTEQKKELDKGLEDMAKNIFGVEDYEMITDENEAKIKPDVF